MLTVELIFFYQLHLIVNDEKTSFKSRLEIAREEKNSNVS